MSENKFSTESAQTEAQGAAAAEELEREAKAGNDITTYTHRFSSPFTFHSITEDAIKDTTVDALTFNWGTLTGADYLAIEIGRAHSNSSHRTTSRMPSSA